MYYIYFIYIDYKKIQYFVDKYILKIKNMLNYYEL